VVDDAGRILWERYLDRLVRLVTAGMKHALSATLDEQYVALSAIDSFRRRADGQFSWRDDRHDPWWILMTIVAR
jgi:hypothetical protein